jgi:hypothetical protein
MLAEQIVGANRTADPLLGGVGAREFAAREFPREDYHWVVATTSPKPARPAVVGMWWGRFRRWLGTPGEIESDPEATPEPAFPA